MRKIMISGPAPVQLLDVTGPLEVFSKAPGAGRSQSNKVRVRRGAPSGRRVSQAASTFDLNTRKRAAARNCRVDVVAARDSRR